MLEFATEMLRQYDDMNALILFITLVLQGSDESS